MAGMAMLSDSPSEPNPFTARTLSLGGGDETGGER